MEVALTFGSVGDIIQLCDLAIKLGRALGEAPCDSAKEYRGLQRDLGIAVRVLSRVADAYSENSNCPQLGGLDSLTEEVIGDCERQILEFLDRWEEKYEDSLGKWRLATRVKRAWRSLEWSLRERNKVQELQAKLNQTVQTITLLGSLAFHGSARVDRAKIMVGTQEVNNHIADIRRAVVSLETAVSEPVLRKALDPTKDMPLFLEGFPVRTLEIPLNLVHSWEMLTAILVHQFENLIGYYNITHHHYVLREVYTEDIIDVSLPLTSSMRPGMRVFMSVIFRRIFVIMGLCPGCRAMSVVMEPTYSKCQGCNMWFEPEGMAIARKQFRRLLELMQSPERAVKLARHPTSTPFIA